MSSPSPSSQYVEALQEQWWTFIDLGDYVHEPRLFYALTLEVQTWFCAAGEHVDRSELQQFVNEGLSCAIMRVHPFLALCCLVLDESVLKGAACCKARLLDLKYARTREQWKDLVRYDRYQQHDEPSALDIQWGELYALATMSSAELLSIP